MSTPLEDSDSSRGGAGSQFVRRMRLLAALSALAAVVLLWAVERAHVAHDLQLAAAPYAEPGQRIAVRALLFRDVDATQGPTLVGASTLVRLRDPQGRELARTALHETALSTLDGELRVPASIAGQFTLEAESELEGEGLRTRRPLRVAEAAPIGPLRGRMAGSLQQLAVGRAVATSPAPVPDPLLVRVVGGACVPELPCRLLVWVGEPAALLRVRTGSGAELIDPPEPPTETSGLVSFVVVVRGLDAEVTLEAHRAGQLVARRAVLLPVGLGEVALQAPRSIIAPGELQLTYAAPPGREHVLVDFFVRGRWRASRVLPSRTEPSRHSFVGVSDAPGLLRIQAHADRFGAESAGARVLYVRAPGESDEHALRRVAALVAREPLAADGFSERWAEALPSFAATDPERAAAFLLAPLESLRRPVPRAVSGRPAQLRALAETRVRMRFGVAGALVASALLIALSMGRRGLRAADEAERILRAARGEAVAAPAGERFRARARVVLLVLAVASAFLAAALLIASKTLWF